MVALGRAVALGALAAYAATLNASLTTPAVTPAPAANVPVAAVNDAVDPAPLVKQAEDLLRRGHPELALDLLSNLPAVAAGRTAWQRVYAHALVAAERPLELQTLVANCDLPPLEIAYLTAVVQRHAHPDEAAKKIATLWWTEPDTIWGLSALRALVEIDEAGYSPNERAAVIAAVDAPTLRSYQQDGPRAAAILAALQHQKPRGGRLAAEFQLALGVYSLHQERLTSALLHLGQALTRTHDPGLRRTIELRVGETRQRQGEFASALRHFERVAAHGDDALGAQARAAAGQMAIEQQRYRDAQRLFRRQLLDNPLGPARASALFGLGWVAFRTGALADARRFFMTLLREEPASQWAPAAAYWGARTLLDQGDRARAYAEFAAVEQHYPSTYYAYRAGERLNGALAPSPTANADVLAARFSPLVLAALRERATAERIPLIWLAGAIDAKNGKRPVSMSGRAELGLFQLTRPVLAALAREETHQHEITALDILDADINLRLSVRYFARIARAFGGRLDYALAAFDAGPGVVTRWRETRGDLPGDIFVEEIPRSETREFVRQTMAAMATYYDAPRNRQPADAPLAHLERRRSPGTQAAK